MGYKKPLKISLKKTITTTTRTTKMPRTPLSPRSNSNTVTSSSSWGSAYKPESTPAELYVSGRKGYNETMNGLYVRGAEHDGRVHYKHSERKFVIRWCDA